MSKITLVDVTNLENENTAVVQMAANNDAITAAVNNTLSLDGTLPNSMLANLDMNSHQILNLPVPTTPASPLRLEDLNSFIGGGTIETIPAGGTTGQALVKKSNTDYDTQWSTSIPPGGALGASLVKTSASDFAIGWSNNVAAIHPETYGAVGDGSTDDTLALQNAINAAMAVGAYVQLSAKTYKFTNTLLVTSRTSIVGTSMGLGSTLLFAPSSNTTALWYTAGGSILSYCGLHNLNLNTADTTHYKIGVRLSDFSVFNMDTVRISGFVGGPSFTVTGTAANGSGEIRVAVTSQSTFSVGTVFAAYGLSIGGTIEANFAWKAVVIDATHIDLKGSTFTNAWTSAGTLVAASTACLTEGRELGAFNDTQMQGDIGLRIAINPNNANGALDTTNFNNSTFTATNTSATILVDDGVTMANVSWTGTQSRGEGKDGFRWVSKSDPAISSNISFDNTRDEQQSTTGGWHYFIKTSSNIYSLVFRNLLMTINGLHIRNTQNLLIAGCSGLGTIVNFDIDSTVTNTTLLGNFWIAGSTATIAGQNILWASAIPVGSSVPNTAFYANSSATASTQGATTFNAPTTTQGTAFFNNPLTLSNATSGSVTLQTPSGALGTVTLTLPITSTTDTIIGKATTDTLTNKTFDTAGTGNVFKIAGTAISANTGTGSNVLSTTPTLAGLTLSGDIAGGGNHLNNTIIGNTTPLAGNFTTLGTTGTIIGGTSITVGTNSVNGATFANGPSSGTGGGSQFVAQLGGTSNIGMGNVSTLITGGTFDSTPCIYGAAAIGIFIGGATKNLILGPNYITTNPVATASLPAATKGARAFVTDATSTTFNAAPVGGGANNMPVFFNGTSWLIG